MSFSEKGFELVEQFLDVEQIETINKQLDGLGLQKNSGGIRNAEKKFSSINDFVRSDTLIKSAQCYLKGSAHFVRAILFDKTKENNWLVTWHQDKIVAVTKKFDSTLWGPWSVKDGLNHVQPPLDVLEKMVTFRIHLDDSNQDNGCLRILPNSHEAGILQQEQIKKLVESSEYVLCPAAKGSALVMRPHLLHASSKAIIPSRRRVLHIELSSYQLPSGIFWT